MEDSNKTRHPKNKEGRPHLRRHRRTSRQGNNIMGFRAIALGVLLSILLLLHLSYAEHFADVIPSLEETQEMAMLSSLVYKFKYHTNFTCDDDIIISQNDYLHCHWYLHDDYLGTQVLLVSNDVKQYVAVVYAGTDDLKTSLEDANVFTKPFGNNETVTFNDDFIHVHAGFNNAVFTHNVWEQVYNKTKELWKEKSLSSKNYQLYTTGHSLGAANAILTATAFALLSKDVFPPVTCITFGAPQTGNSYWRNYFNGTSPLRDRLSIFRVVLAWDVVARLPEFFYHVGHTVQMMDGKKNNEVRVYYEHYGDERRGYAGAPLGWYSRAAWLPYALNYHRMRKYSEHIQKNLNQSTWSRRFFPVDGTVYDDDDIWDNPPDDWIMQEEDVVEFSKTYPQID